MVLVDSPDAEFEAGFLPTVPVRGEALAALRAAVEDLRVVVRTDGNAQQLRAERPQILLEEAAPSMTTVTPAAILLELCILSLRRGGSVASKLLHRRSLTTPTLLKV